VRETTVGMPLPAERPVAMLVPDQPALETVPRRGRLQIYSRQFRDAKPINFGRVSPRSYPVHGVDVSRWQGDIDWAKLRTQGANFAYIKATDGGDHLDPMFRTNWRRAEEAGHPKRGAYHFFYWCRTAGEQADWFIRNVPRDPERAAAGDRRRVERGVELQGETSVAAPGCSKRCRSSWTSWSATTASGRSSTRRRTSTADNLSGRTFPNSSVLAARGRGSTRPRSIRAAGGCSGNIRARACRTASPGKIDLNVFNGSEEDWHNWVAARSS
jgi:lysozyme